MGLGPHHCDALIGKCFKFHRFTLFSDGVNLYDPLSGKKGEYRNRIQRKTHQDVSDSET